MESYDVAESGYPEEQQPGAQPNDDGPGVAPQESAAAPDKDAERAPQSDEGRTATGNPQTDRRTD